MSTHLKLIRTTAEPLCMPRGSVYAIIRQVRRYMHAKKENTMSAREAAGLPAVRPASIQAMILTAEGHERRAGFLREEGKHKQAEQAMREAASLRKRAEAMQKK